MLLFSRLHFSLDFLSLRLSLLLISDFLQFLLSFSLLFGSSLFLLLHLFLLSFALCLLGCDFSHSALMLLLRKNLFELYLQRRVFCCFRWIRPNLLLKVVDLALKLLTLCLELKFELLLWWQFERWGTFGGKGRRVLSGLIGTSEMLSCPFSSRWVTFWTAVELAWRTRPSDSMEGARPCR